ncbi:MAG: hypothetical protein ACPGJS_00690 [Flammeovirgaceae bacterium]
MNDNFDLQHQYKLYLQRVNLDESTMHPVQRIETKRAFMGACGQMLLLLRDDLTQLSEEKAAETLQDMITQVQIFFTEECKRINSTLNN